MRSLCWLELLDVQPELPDLRRLEPLSTEGIHEVIFSNILQNLQIRQFSL